MCVHVCVDGTETETAAEDLVSLYTEHETEQQTAQCNTADIVDEDVELSPSRKRLRRCLAECDVNSSELNDVKLAACSDAATTCEPSAAAEARPAVMPLSPQKHNKENDDAMTVDAAAAGDTLKSPTHSFKSPPSRRSVFAQSSVTRQRFNLNASKDSVTSPQHTVEVRSRSVTRFIICIVVSLVLKHSLLKSILLCHIQAIHIHDVSQCCSCASQQNDQVSPVESTLMS